MQQIFSGHLLYVRACVRNWRISRNKTTDTTPVIREILNSGGRKHHHKKQYSCQLVTLAVEVGGKRNVEMFMELKVL